MAGPEALEFSPSCLAFGSMFGVFLPLVTRPLRY